MRAFFTKKLILHSALPAILCRTVDQHVLTRSRQELILAWAGQSYLKIGGSAVLGRAHIG